MSLVRVEGHNAVGDLEYAFARWIAERFECSADDGSPERLLDVAEFGPWDWGDVGEPGMFGVRGLCGCVERVGHGLF